MYLITGGLGGLGFIIAGYLAKTYKARLVLTGRSALDLQKQEQLRLLEHLGGAVVYLEGDVAKIGVAEQWLAKTKDCFGTLNGIIHCAGAMYTAPLSQKNWHQVEQVLAAKLQGTLNLDAATQNESLESFVLFSSTSACLGLENACDYASANAFLGAFAQWREQQSQKGQRSGKTVAIDWPYWQEGGLQVNDIDLERYTLDLGMAPLPTAEGLLASGNKLLPLMRQRWLYFMAIR